MASPIEASMIPADYAVVGLDGKVTMVGAGWSNTSAPTSPQAVVALIKVPWDRANLEMPVTLVLEDADGRPVEIESEQGGDPQPVEVDGTLEAGRPPGSTRGSDLDSALAINVPSMPLSPGRYMWRLTIADAVITTSFEVRAAPLGR